MNTEVIASSIAGVLFIALLSTLLLRKRQQTDQEGLEDIEPRTEPTSNGPPTSTAGPPVSNFTQHEQMTEPTETNSTGPQLPEDGLPPGWTSEQWQYYGQQYLDTKQ